MHKQDSVRRAARQSAKAHRQRKANEDRKRRERERDAAFDRLDNTELEWFRTKPSNPVLEHEVSAIEVPREYDGLGVVSVKIERADPGRLLRLWRDKHGNVVGVSIGFYGADALPRTGADKTIRIITRNGEPWGVPFVTDRDTGPEGERPTRPDELMSVPTGATSGTAKVRREGGITYKEFAFGESRAQ